MAGRRKIVVEKDYDSLIKACDEQIEKHTNDLKALRAKRKQLIKDKTRYDEQKAEEEKAQKMKEISEMIASSNKTMDEIKAFLEIK